MARDKNELIQKIIAASNKTEAVEAIKDLMKILNLSSNTQDMYIVNDDLKNFGKKLENLQARHIALGVDKQYHEVQSIRTETAFLYRDLVDQHYIPVTMLKKILEDDKKTVENEAMDWVMQQDSYKNSVTKSTVRNFIGGCPAYKKWVRENALAYTNYQYLTKILESMNLFVDSLASELRNMGTINKQDAK